MKRERQISDELLVKYLLGEASETELSDVKGWMGESAENKDRFDSFRLIWEQSRLLAAGSTIDADDAWARFKQRRQQPAAATKQIPLQTPYRWVKIAAALLLLAGGGWLAYFQASYPKPETISGVVKEKPIVAAPGIPKYADSHVNVKNAGVKTQVIAKSDIKKSSDEVSERSLHRVSYMSKKSTKPFKNYYSKALYSTSRTKGFICNSTPCPIEICITQSVKCRHDRSTPISTCNVLEPDQSGKLHYTALNKISRHCKATIDEITITMISTGETIVLNDHSTPSTAQNFFNHITGKKKGEVYAGVFHSDCNNETDNCGLTFDSNYGNLILQ